MIITSHRYQAPVSQRRCQRCKNNHDCQFQLNGSESHFFCTIASWQDHSKAIPAVLKAPDNNATMRFPGPPPCASAHPPAARPTPRRPLQPGRDWPVAARTTPEAKAREGGAYQYRHSVAPPTEESLYSPSESAAWKLTLRVNGKCLKYLCDNKISR